MKSFLTLAKVSFLSGFNTNRKTGNQKNSFFLFGGFLLGGLVLSAIYHFLISGTLGQAGFTLDQYLVLTLIAASLLTFMISVVQMGNTFFQAADFEMLQSLPIKERNIILAKFLSVYLISFAEDVIIIVPGLVFFLCLGGMFLHALFAFIAMFFVSLIPLLVASLIGALVAAVTARVKNKTLVTVILYLILMVAIFGISFGLSFSLGSGSIGQISDNLLPYFKLLSLSFVSGQEYFFLLFLLIHVVSFLLTLMILSWLYHPVNALSRYHTFHEAYKEGEKTIGFTPVQAIRKKETKLLTKNPNYFINSYMGSFLFSVTSIFLVIIFPFLVEGEAKDQTMLVFFSGAILLLEALFNSITSSTSFSVSMEGKNIEFLFAYPLNVKMILREKMRKGILIPLMMNLAVGAILSLLYSLLIQWDVVIVVSFMLFPSLVSTATAYIGMFCGLRWPKLHYENTMQLLKNSACGNLTMLFSALPAMVLFTIYFIGTFFFEGRLGLRLIWLLVFAGIYLAAIIVLHIMLKKNGEKLFYKVLER